ncbi:MAG: AtpZ/AtpI family protein [Pseudomonadota bacterium]
MASGDSRRSPGKGAGNRDQDDNLDLRRQSVEAKIAARRKQEEDKLGADKADTAPGVAQAFKLSSEFIAGVVAGAGLGYLIDTFAGTTPWGMIIFLLLGFAAGVLNVLRSAGLAAQPDYAKPPSERGDK